MDLPPGAEELKRVVLLLKAELCFGRLRRPVAWLPAPPSPESATSYVPGPGSTVAVAPAVCQSQPKPSADTRQGLAPGGQHSCHPGSRTALHAVHCRHTTAFLAAAMASAGASTLWIVQASHYESASQGALKPSLL